ncbi:MAG: hypothetical protein HYY13_02880 [Nitrospirae bacterium]|nr:hypothetical protein [Nitrospirota bacterium]
MKSEISDLKSQKPVAILGIGRIPFRVGSNATHFEMVDAAVRAALADARMEAGEIDTVVDAGIDLLDGKGISNTELLAAAGCMLKEEVKLEEDGATAAYYAWIRLRSGFHRTALVFAYSKSTSLSLEAYSSMMFNPVLHRPLGLTDTITLTLQAAAYAHRYGVGPADADALLQQARQTAARNPWLAEMPPAAPSTDVVSSPLRACDLPHEADGAVALVLGTADALSPHHAPVWIAGAALAVDTHDVGERPTAEIRSLCLAAERAFNQAGLKDPRREAACAEISEPTTYHAFMIAEALGLADAGRGAHLWTQDPGDRLGPVINASGGLISARALVAAGLGRIADATDAIRRGDPLALAHGTSGIAMQSNTVFVLSSRRPRAPVVGGRRSP